ncbi:MAG TPA: TonB-dependent receptor, partial [Hyphomicrobiaceae bacterium]|nr:TonB-dependent receptor [Hyphomicrobiaceae bacterium]
VEVIQQQPQPTPKPQPVAKPKPKKKTVQQAQQPQPAPEQAPAPQPVAPPLTQPAAGAGAYAAPALANGIRMSPLAGSEIALEKVPGAVGRATAADFARQPTPTPQSAIETQVPGAILTDVQGNAFQTQIDYRGFYASPLPGVAQGLAVYQNGVRINEAFGDMVNFDFLPSNAISDITIVSGNPVFGLNAVGGAAVITMRDGFNFHGTEIDTRFGSDGRYQGGLATGLQSGNWAAFLALEGIHDDGWRDFSPSRIKRLYADVGFKDSRREFHLNFTTADNFVGVVAASPVELLAQGWERTFTSPQTSDNQVAMLSFNGSVKATDTLTVSGLTYFRRFKQRHVDGNIAEFAACQDPGNLGYVCALDDTDSEFQLTSGGAPIAVDDDAVLGSVDRTGQTANGYGFTLQAVEKREMFSRPNQLTLGVSYDGGHVKYRAGSEVGVIGPRFVVGGLGAFIDGPLEDDNEYLPRSITSRNNYWGLYVLDTLDVTGRLSLTFGGRYNHASIDLKDNTGNFADINGTSTYQRFNPSGGATFKLFPGLSVYGGYSQANRAPTPAELACADPDNPCLIESFLTDDPPLKQVVSKTWEFGFKGESVSPSGFEKVQWSIGYFRTLSKDDILPLPAHEAGRGYFANAGDTLRQGIEFGVNYASPRLKAYANYAYVDATYQDTNVFPSPNINMAGTDIIDCDTESAYDPNDANMTSCVIGRSGDRLSGVPRHRFKSGFNYAITERWKFGADLVASSNQVFFGDEANVARRLPSWWRVNLNTSYDITENIQVYGIINNVFDKRYGLFGNFFGLDDANEAAEAAGLGDSFFTDPRTIMPAAPVAAYGGVKIKF